MLRDIDLVDRGGAHVGLGRVMVAAHAPVHMSGHMDEVSGTRDQVCVCCSNANGGSG